MGRPHANPCCDPLCDFVKVDPPKVAQGKSSPFEGRTVKCVVKVFWMDAPRDLPM